MGFFENVKTDSTGWALKGSNDESFTKEEKQSLMALVRFSLERRRERGQDGTPLYMIVESVTNKHTQNLFMREYPERKIPQAFKEACVQDWIYAVVDRACRCVGAEQVYTLGRTLRSDPFQNKETPELTEAQFSVLDKLTNRIGVSSIPRLEKRLHEAGLIEYREVKEFGTTDIKVFLSALGDSAVGKYRRSKGLPEQ